MTITSAFINGDRRAVIEFTLEDDEGTPVPLSALDRDPRFILAWIDEEAVSGRTRYQAYTLRTAQGAPYEFDGQTLDPVVAEAQQPTSDSGGTIELLAAGSYRYTSGTVLPVGYDRRATHTVGAYVHREDRRFVDNPLFHFVPSGGDPITTRDVTPTANCNECHNPIEAHGGVRREIGLCILCHTDQGLDPETGNTIEMGHMIHRIHTGEELSIKPYLIVGYRQSVHDYSDVVFPQETRNCTKCHKDGDDSANWLDMPSRSACGGCHDDVNFATGENHFEGLSQENDIFCSACHRGSDVPVKIEFDRSVAGSHVIPYESEANPQLTLAITDVQNMTPGTQPSVRFTIADSSGPVDITTLDRVAIVFGGPTGDYIQLISLDHRFTIQGGGASGTLTVNDVGDYTFAPEGYVIPADATGTWSVGMEARTGPIEAGGEEIEFGANNPIVDIDLADGTLGGGSPVPRRAIVGEAQCDSCHGDLRFHGNLRTELAYCLLCHNPWTTDEARRPDLDAVTNPPAHIDMKFMVHRIHRGAGLENPYVVYGFGGSEHDYSHVEYPGNLRDCEQCHLEGTHLLPVAASAQAVVVNIGGVPVPHDNAIRPPVTAACTACHDSTDSAVHARVNSIITGPFDWGEACRTCHGEGKNEAVSEVHATE
jgi:OmcA/MtrC family decaheme c-type cytochrome